MYEQTFDINSIFLTIIVRVPFLHLISGFVGRHDEFN